MKKIINQYKHAWVLLYFFIYMVWFTALEKRNVPILYDMEIWLDHYIPFNEWFIIPYFLWFAYIAGVVLYLFFHSKEDYYKTCAFLFIGMTICLIIYTIWPNGQSLRPDNFQRDNIFTYLVSKLYATDTSTNVCPSIHVFNSIGAHIAVTRSQCFKKHFFVKGISFILMVSISFSTVFLKQHSVFDGFCSIILSIFMYMLVYKIDYVKIHNRVKENAATV